jgi:hypothetical protein
MATQNVREHHVQCHYVFITEAKKPTRNILGLGFSQGDYEGYYIVKYDDV